MAYLAKLNKCILCPPKNGTHTIQYIANRVRGDCQLRGHMTAGTIVGRLGFAPQFGMTVRDPIDRFLSIMNYFSEARVDESNPGSNDLWDQFWRVRNEFWALPQAHWCRDWPVELFPFEDLPVVRWIGWKGEIPHMHPTPKKRWTRESIEPIADMVMDYFAEDYGLRELAHQSDHSPQADSIGVNGEQKGSAD